MSTEIFELNTGVIPSAIYADKLRRTALAIIKNVPTQIIIRDIAELNKQLYTKLIEEMKIEKGEPIRITLRAKYNPELQKIEFSDLKIVKYVNEELLKNKYESEISKLNSELNELKNKIEEVKKDYEAKIESMKEKINEYEKLIDELKKYKENYESLVQKISRIYNEIKEALGFS